MRSVWVSALFVAVFAVACGGGGGGDDGTADVPSGAPDAAASTDASAETSAPCLPTCDERECGDDGCGGSCGSCFDANGLRAPELCVAGACCLPDCAGKECGDDGCGGSCGSCFAPSGALDESLCVAGACCVPQCGGKHCGPNGCGGTCGECGAGLECSDDDTCEPPCEPDCTGLCCGDDGCGGTCEDTCAEALGDCDLASCTCYQRYPVCDDQPIDFPVCPTLEPAPTSPAGLATFVLDNADPLYCLTGAGDERAMAAFVADVGDARVVMFGEVHGTAQLGHVSADLFEALVRAGVANAVAMEMGIDLSEPMDTYVKTGGGPLVHAYGFNHFPPDLFATTLISRARELQEEGFEIHAFAVDSPMRMAYVNEQLEAVAATLSPDAAALLREGMPAALDFGEDPGAGFLAQAEAYRAHVVANEAALCEGVSERLCDRMLRLSDAFWVGYSHYYRDLDAMPYEEALAFLDRREQLIYHAYRWNIGGAEGDTGRVVYTHMGAAHTCRSGDGETYGGVNAGGMLDNDFPLTTGKVYSTHAAWGAGSSIRYGGVLYDQAPEPALLAEAMEGAPGEQYAVSLYRPGKGCVTNPLETSLRQTYYFAPYSDCYDTLVYIRQITPERAYKSGLPPVVEQYLRRRDALSAWR